MSGVSISPAPLPSQVELDVRAAYEGGGNFMARLQQLSDAKARHDESLAELNLGKTAHEAFTEASAKRLEAVGALDDAKTVLTQANARAAAILAQATDEATAMKAKVQKKIDALQAAIDQAKAI